MPKWSDFGSVVSTIRELDVTSIRVEADHPFSIVCIGHEQAIVEIERLLHAGPQRYPLPGPSPLTSVPIRQATEYSAAIRTAALLILAIDASQPLTGAEAEGFSRLDALAISYLVVVLNGTHLPGGTLLSPAISTRVVALPEPQALTAPDQLAVAVLERLPAEAHLAAARRLPGLRPIYSRELIAQISFSNATYALASGLPEQIPLLNIPFAAADILVLTKNQAMLTYRLALAHGAPPDFQARIAEVIPVIGGAFLWRQAARSLIGLIPIWGLVPKVAIAYAGTYTTGIAAWRWYELGEMASREQLKKISNEALAIGRARAEELIAKARTTSGQLKDHAQSIGARIGEQAQALGAGATERARGAGSLLSQARDRLPFRKKLPK